MKSRRYFALLPAAIRIIRKEGWRAFWRRAKNYYAQQSRVRRLEVKPLKIMPIDMKQCSICGTSFSLPDPAHTDNLRETILCHNCGAILRHQDVASVLLKVINSRKNHLIDALSEFSEMSIYLLESYGPIYNTLCQLTHFVCSEFFEDIPVGSSKGNIRCEDVQNLTFPNRIFDIIITQDIFEHVDKPEIGFSEIHRVLKPGGFHITTIPFDGSLDKNRKRAIYANGKIIHILPPVYHGDAIRSGLVFTDFGLGLFDMMQDAGFVVSKYETEYPGYRGGYNCVFICQKFNEYKPPTPGIKNRNNGDKQK